MWHSSVWVGEHHSHLLCPGPDVVLRRSLWLSCRKSLTLGRGSPVPGSPLVLLVEVETVEEKDTQETRGPRSDTRLRHAPFGRVDIGDRPPSTYLCPEVTRRGM